MSHIRMLFASPLYQAALEEAETLNAALKPAIADLAREDGAGKAWSKAHGYDGYTSYASLDDLPARDPAFSDLKRALDRHAAQFAEALHLDLGRRKPRLNALWVNVLAPGGAHSGHIHPGSIISGTYYVDTPAGASALKFEDPRLPMMMAAPPKRADAPEEARPFLYVAPKAGVLLMWESFLRHEVPPNRAKRARVSVSFNYS